VGSAPEYVVAIDANGDDKLDLIRALEDKIKPNCHQFFELFCLDFAGTTEEYSCIVPESYDSG
jgi:hypothetical protein